MVPTSSLHSNSTPVRIGNKLSTAFGRVEDRIRERAYQIFLGREPDQGDPVTDWLDARMQVLAPIELILKEQKKNIVVEGNLKGFAPREIEVEVGADGLKIFGSHTESKTSNGRGQTQSSSTAEHFFQAMSLPCEVDAKTTEAKLLKNGKLKITLPKKSPSK